MRQRWQVPSGSADHYLAAADQRVFLLVDGIACHRADTGARAWFAPMLLSNYFQFLAPGGDALYSFLTPVVGNAVQCVLDCRDSATGAARWQRQLTELVEALAGHRDGVLTMSRNDGMQVTGYDADGEVRWRRTGELLGPVVDGAALVGDPRGTALVDARTGVPRWRIRPGRFAALATSPDGRFATGYGDLGGVPPHVARIDLRDGSERWRRAGEVDAAADDGANLVVSGNHRETTGLDPATGAERWRTATAGDLALTAGLAWILVGSDTRVVDAASGAQVATPFAAAPRRSTVVGDLLVTTDGAHLTAYGPDRAAAQPGGTR
ncbi:outer membrane protein assembly factor BamB family protein [Pilimelia anulata]|uniref:outer membrane protein assembly factor BamB family protein n=1 Tax=Pilimelia anulata TaxID=53371 RepID=UPI001666D670|nr:PQQ-binding-like beta-propeller repeat protein [Pilimelia anulata]